LSRRTTSIILGFVNINAAGAHSMSEALKLVCHECGKVNRLPASRLGEGPKCGACGAALDDGRVHALDTAMLERSAATDGMPLVVDFWAPWCGPCLSMAPQFERAAAALRGQVRFAKIDTERHPDAARGRGIRGIPALILYRDGREIARRAGAMTADAIARWLQEAVAARA
jgi:thioredoxin 2